MKKLFFIFLVFILFTSLFCSYSIASNKFIVDNANIIDAQSEEELNRMILDMRSSYSSDFVILTVSSLNGKTPRDYADDYYDYNGYADDGVLLLICTGSRDIYISSKGFGIDAFTDYGIEKALDLIVDDISSVSFAKGAKTFLERADLYYSSAKNGQPFDVSNEPTPANTYIIILVAVWIVALSIGLIVVTSMKSKLKSIRPQQNADIYMTSSEIDLLSSRDLFLYRNISRVPIPKSTSSGGSSTHRSSSGSSHGGGGRKF